MKNYLKYFFIALPLLIFNNSCEKKLDIKPLNILISDQIFQSISGINAYMASLYSTLPIEDFNFASSGNFLCNQTDEAISSYAEERTSLSDGSWYQWWDYSSIRNVNDFIVKLPTAKISDADKSYLLGEALFIRVFYYFALVKRYGGVPIIKEVQSYTGDNLADLQVPRNTEKEVWDFIASDLDLAISLLPETNAKGRANKYVALSLKSRAMLYAASIAKYGSINLNGLVGIPSSEADKYWQSAYDAAALIINSGIYSLYNKTPDKELNFTQLFIDPDNPEAIFSVLYQYPYKGHGYDASCLPFGIRGPGGGGSQIGPSVECLEQFEYIDGTPGTLKLNNPDGSPIFYENVPDLFMNKDPRCLASVIVPFSKFENYIIDVQAGIYDLGIKTEAGDFSALYNPTTHQQDNVNGTLHIVGLSGFGGTEKSQTGLYIRKYLNYNMSPLNAMGGHSDQSWIAFRYGEILLNYAEAAIELSKVSDAKWAVNEIRGRAGIKLLDDSEVTLDRVRHERNIELAFENHRWWDYIRWRISDKEFNNTHYTALKPYYDIQANAYRFEVGMVGRWPHTFDPKVYYTRIDPSEISKNPKLIQNPGY